MTRFTFMTAALATSLAFGTAMAAKPQAASRTSATVSTALTVDKSVKRLPFGKDHKAVLKWVRRHMSSKRLSSTAIKQGLKRVEASKVAFVPKADLSAWDKSVVATEFKVGNDESMLSYDDGKHTHYFFFFQGKLFKYAKPVPLPPTRLGFVDRVNTLSKSLGAPTGTIAPGGGDRVVEARWIKSKVETSIVDKRATHNADMLVVRDSKLASTVLASRRGQGPNGKTYEVDPSLKEFLE